jgi:hypothetical protein
MLPLVTRLVQASGDRPLESMLKEIQDEAARYQNRHSELASIRYYLQVAISQTTNQWRHEAQGATNYLALLDRIQRCGGSVSDTIFATFNYDCMFEHAATFYATNGRERSAHRYMNMASYIDGSMFKLVKLHGSIDWGQKVEALLPAFASGSQYDVALEVIDRIDGLAISAEIMPGVDQPPGRTDDHPYVPAIAIPVDQKNTFVTPLAHLAFLGAELPKVSAVLTIGWRGMEDHFLQMLRQKLPANVSLCIVSGDLHNGHETLRQMNISSLGDAEVFPGGFSQFVTGTGVDTFLEKVWRR